MNDKSLLLYSVFPIVVSLNKLFGLIIFPASLLIFLNLANVVILHFILRRVFVTSWKFGTYLHLCTLLLLAAILTVQTNGEDPLSLSKSFWCEATIFSGAWLLLFYSLFTESEIKTVKSINLVHAQKHENGDNDE
ncbi:TPA: hypothetical protein ACVBYD_004111 [Yersinia enterocolitica]|uniref:Uncharacterized protein n=1 Tax=Yersinia enterocolitica TaxID=630 RepID=B0RKM8_YEREN|nr:MULTISPECIES: hypothetical protein [Yersinia]OWF72978.1 hypothetical protein B4903_22110 [Yersinia frederiksenii]ALG47356.1 hypothetical protein LI89_22320 [Yersinia enterocolitica]EKN3781644.1 hypothetical protein [Yersinia enterocolitica]EKN3829056.1 hypothetical protein [Yersinia enterocolitica]EKN3883072.1 hypothetical protein [Yersinia enterocolitica]